MLERWRWGAAALATETLAAVVVLQHALGESIHSDGQLMVFGVGVLGLGAASVALSADSGRRVAGS